MPVALITTIGTTVGAGALGVGAGVLGALETAGIGAALGAGTSAIFGRDPGKGAIFGALGGAGQALAPAIGGALDIGKTGGLALTGAATGAIGSAITGGDVGKGALFGGAGGLASGVLGDALGGAKGATSPSGSAPGAGGAGAPSAVGASAIGQGGIPDLTAPVAGIENVNVTAPSTAGANVGALNLGAAAGQAGGSITSENLPPPGQEQQGGLSTPLGGTALAAETPVAPAASGSVTNVGASPAAGAAKANSVGTFFHDPTLANLGGIAKANPTAVIGGAALAYEAATAPKLPSSSGLTNQLKGQADTLSANGAQLMSYLNNGTLPPGAMSLVNQATASAKATIKSKYAALGLSGSTSEASALAGVDQQAAGQIFTMANALLQDGIKESGLSTEIYTNLLKETNTQNANMSSAITNFAASLAGGGSRGVNINVGGHGDA